MNIDLLRYWGMLSKYEKSATEAVHSNLGASFKRFMVFQEDWDHCDKNFPH